MTAMIVNVIAFRQMLKVRMTTGKNVMKMMDTTSQQGVRHKRKQVQDVKSHRIHWQTPLRTRTTVMIVLNPYDKVKTDSDLTRIILNPIRKQGTGNKILRLRVGL